MSVRLIIFIVLSLLFLWVSRNSLRSLKSHGFYRFFAWEAILGLVLLNSEVWFNDPWSLRQLLSWFLLIGSSYLAIDGFRLLWQLGKFDNKREDPTLMSFEKTTELVTTGLYRYVRHPLYGALIFGTWGALLKHPGLIETALAITASFFMILTMRFEERENISYFGSSYEEYMKISKMFIPKIF